MKSTSFGIKQLKNQLKMSMNLFYKALYFVFDKDSRFFDYPADTWLIFKEKFVAYCPNLYLHFGNSAPFLVEGGHVFFKNFIDKSSYDLIYLFQQLNLLL